MPPVPVPCVTSGNTLTSVSLVPRSANKSVERGQGSHDHIGHIVILFLDFSPAFSTFHFPTTHNAWQSGRMPSRT